MNIIKLGTVVLILSTLGCATPRYLSLEEDQKMGETCGANHDCAVVPGEQWRIIEQILQKFIGI